PPGVLEAGAELIDQPRRRPRRDFEEIAGVLVLSEQPLDSLAERRVALAGLVEEGGPVPRVGSVPRLGKEGCSFTSGTPAGRRPTAQISATSDQEVRTDSQFFLSLLLARRPGGQTGSWPRLSSSHARA